MARTFDELLEFLAENLDEVTLMEILEINSYDVVEAFSDRIKNNLDKFSDIQEEDHEY
jgi:hypothetical protein